MRFENLITLTASFVLFESVSGDLCSNVEKLRKIRKNHILNNSEGENDYNKYETDNGEVCGEGYEPRFCNETVFVCEPLCPAGCENGTCNAPGICNCAEGYELRKNSEKTECVPLHLNNDERLTLAHALTKRNAEANTTNAENTTDANDAAEKAAAYIYWAKWWITIGCIFIGLMLIPIVYLCVRIYQTRHETGAHDIPISLLMKF